MNIFKFLILIISFSSIYGQSSGKAVYGKKWVDPYTETERGQELKKTNPKLYKEYLQTEKEQNKLTKQLRYHLDFNKNEGLFYLEDIMSIDDNPMIRLATGPFQGEYYQNNINDNVIWQLESFDGDYLIDLNPVQWNLENKQKTINGYKCYKAVGEEKTSNNGNEVTTQVVAWYAPDIPFNFGPIGYNGLPGLIVSLSTRGEHYFLEDIQLSKDKKEIDEPTKGERMTYQEFVGMFDKKMEKIRP